jgi:hypothetical protein
MATRFSDHLLTGDHASRPAANTVPDGTLYACSDHDLIYQSDGATWSTWATLGAAPSDVAYDATTWNGNTDAPTKNAVRDKIESMGGGSGALVLIEQHTASASASLDFTTWYSSTYDEYMIEIVSLVTSTSAQPGFEMSTNGGSSYDTGNNYQWRSNYAYSGGVGLDGADPASRLNWRGASVTLSTEGAYNGTFRLYNPASASLWKAMTGQAMFIDASGLWLSNWCGVYESTTAVDAFRVIPSAGTLTSGVVRVYGIVK